VSATAHADVAEDLERIEELRGLLTEVRAYVREHIPAGWPDLAGALGGLVEGPSGPRPLLPLAACAAVGGEAREAVPVAAAWEVAFVAGGILDDLQDQDRAAMWSILGEARAFNFSAALFAFAPKLLIEAPWPDVRVLALCRSFHEETVQLFAGQDRDLRGETRTLDDYWLTIGTKTANAFAWACGAGALCGSDDPELVRSCRTYGYHLGLALQVFDDFQGLWEPVGTSDLANGKVTLPLLYGLWLEHSRREELRSVVAGGRLAAEEERVREILDGIGARDYLVWVALQERDRAVAALERCPGVAGVTALSAYATTIFARMGEVTSPALGYTEHENITTPAP
jgi:geranylgeranyl diphosphate synthase, type I